MATRAKDLIRKKGQNNPSYVSRGELQTIINDRIRQGNFSLEGLPRIARRSVYSGGPRTKKTLPKYDYSGKQINRKPREFETIVIDPQTGRRVNPNSYRYREGGQNLIIQKVLKPETKETAQKVATTEPTTVEQDVSRALGKSSIRTQDLKADYDALARQLQLQQQAIEQEAGLRRSQIEDLTSSERIRQMLAFSGVGEGQSGLGSQLNQKTSIKRYNTMADFRRDYQSKLMQNRITQEVERKRFFQKIKADKSFLDELGKQSVAGADSSFSISKSMVELLKTQVRGSELDNSEFLGQSIIEQKLAPSIKDAKRREDFLNKWLPLAEELGAPFYNSNRPEDLEASLIEKEDAIIYFSPSTGEIYTANNVDVGGQRSLVVENGNVESKNIRSAILEINSGAEKMIDYIEKKGFDSDFNNLMVDLLTKNPNIMSQLLVKQVLPNLYKDYVKKGLPVGSLDEVNNQLEKIGKSSSLSNNDGTKDWLYKIIRDNINRT